MAARARRFSDKVLALIYFIGYEAAVYYLLHYLLFDQEAKNPDKFENTIVRDWNAFIYFLLLYVAITLVTMLLLTTMLPRPYKPQIMRYYWWSWLGLLVMLVVAFN